MSEKIPAGFRGVGATCCAGCRHLGKYPNANEFFCAHELHQFTLGHAPTIEHYVCGDHKPPVGRWEPGTTDKICEDF